MLSLNKNQKNKNHVYRATTLDSFENAMIHIKNNYLKII